MNSHVPVIAVLDTPALKGARSTLRGIIDYAERHGPWRLLFLESRDEEQVFDYAKLGCDAAVACRVPQSDVLPIAKLKVPVILCEPLGGLIGANTPLAEFPVVRMDSRAVGAMAAKYYLERGYRSFAYVGETLGMSPVYLGRLFIERTGIKLTDYIAECRLRHACDQLRQTNKSVKEIAASSGYADANYFAKVFRQHKGMSPLEYRASRDEDERTDRRGNT